MGHPNDFQCIGIDVSAPARVWLHCQGIFLSGSRCSKTYSGLRAYGEDQHAVDFGGSVTVHGMVVEHNDVIHADLHGAVVIPSDVVKDIPEAVAEMNRREAVILAAARSADFSIDKLKAVISGDGDIH